MMERCTSCRGAGLINVETGEPDHGNRYAGFVTSCRLCHGMGFRLPLAQRYASFRDRLDAAIDKHGVLTAARFRRIYRAMVDYRATHGHIAMARLISQENGTLAALRERAAI